MKALFVFSLMLLSAGTAAQSVPGTRDRNTEIRDRFVGAWKLVSLEEPSADGQVHRADCTGMFVFTRDGKASVQVMYRTAQTGSAMRKPVTKLPTEATASRTLPLSRSMSRAHWCEHLSAKT